MRILAILMMLGFGVVQAQEAPKKSLLNNLNELNQTAINANGGALGCGTMIIEVDGKQKQIGSSLGFLFREGQANLDQLHAICYAVYSCEVLKDSSYGVPNSSLCYAACEVLSVSFNEQSVGYLSLLLNTSAQRYTIQALKRIGEEDLKERRRIIKKVAHILLPDEGRPGGWLNDAMRQPLHIKITSNDQIKLEGKAVELEEFKLKMEAYTKKYNDNYVLVSYDEKASDEIGNQVNRFLYSIGVSAVDASDYE